MAKAKKRVVKKAKSTKKKLKVLPREMSALIKNTGLNLPPGCNVSDLPGNTKADQEREVFDEWLSNIIGDDQTDDFDEISEAIWKAIGKAYADGYAQGASDERMAAGQA